MPDMMPEMLPEVVENDDGSAFIPDEQSPDPQQVPFYSNLTTVLSQRELDGIADELIELIEHDKDSRKKRDKQYEEGLRRTGLGDDAPGGADFDGASKVVSPVLAEACVDFSSAAIKALFPSDGPVKMAQVDRGKPADFDRAERKRDYMNWQCTTQMPEYRAELEVLLTQQPLSGNQYLKFWYDADRGRPCVEYFPIDRVYLPFEASNFESASRRTLVVPLNQFDYSRRVRSGMYSDVDVGLPPSFNDEVSGAEKANQKIEGKEESGFNEDGLRFIYEVYTWLDFEGQLSPYIVSIDEYSRKVVGLYRNWNENDQLRREIDWVVEWVFIPWRGAYGIGLIHLIGGLAAAATGSLRALLDSAHLANLPGGVKLKGARSTGDTVQVSATEIAELDAPPNVDDIRKVFMPWPFPGPNATLFQLLGWITDAAKGVVATADEKIGENNNQMPVGTIMALIEQGSKTFSAIHLRLHTSQAKALRILQRINANNLNPQDQLQKFGRQIVTQEDFAVPDDIMPVSDPNIFSEAQRFAQMQGLLQMSSDQGVQWNKIQIYRRMMAIMKVENPDEILPLPPQPFTHMIPWMEAQPAMNGTPLRAEAQQNHIQHIMAHLGFILDPVFGAANPATKGNGYGIMMDHVQQHLVMLFQSLHEQAMQAATMSVQQEVAGRLPPGLNPQMVQGVVQQQMQQMQPMIMQRADAIFAQQRQQLMPIVQMMQQAGQLVQTKVPPPPLDPQAEAAKQVAQMQEETKRQIAQIREAGDEKDRENRRASAEAELQLKTYIETQIRPAIDRMDAQIALQRNRDDNQQHQITELIKNRDDNNTNLAIAQLREEVNANRAITMEQIKQEAESNRHALTEEFRSMLGQMKLEQDMKESKKES